MVLEGSVHGCFSPRNLIRKYGGGSTWQRRIFHLVTDRKQRASMALKVKFNLQAMIPVIYFFQLGTTF
jgi:hypothetical protein